MKLSTSDLDVLTDLAISAATDAGAMVAASRPIEVEHKAGADSLASQVVTEIDRRSEDIILDILRPTLDRFELGLLTEEQDDDGGRLVADNFWCIDPLDGTLPFIEGVPGYAVSIALVDRSGAPLIGVVFDPVESTVMHAIAGGGIVRNGQPWSIESSSDRLSEAGSGQDVLSVFADRSFLDWPDHDVIVEALGRIAGERGLAGLEFHTSGAAVMNACGVLGAAPACYFKYPKTAGGGCLWDYAATTCLFNEAGFVASDIHGNPLELNRADSTFMNHRGVLFATDNELALRLQELYLSVRGN